MIEHDEHEILAPEQYRQHDKSSFAPWQLIRRPSPQACAASQP
jgi:hypothetical protein